MSVAHYPAIIEHAPGGFGVFFPDLPGCTSGGDTVEDAARNAKEALQGHVELGAEHGDVLPPPTALDGISPDLAIEEAARLLVRVELPERIGFARSGVPASKT